jgi:hypothetical protein
MTWRDKLEIGLKENASFRKDNLPLAEVTGPELGQGPGRSAEIPDARTTRTEAGAAASEASLPGARAVPPHMPNR